MQRSLTRRGLLYLNFFLVMSVFNNRSNAQKNFSQCFNKYCYFWSGNVSTYKDLEPCSEPHWDVEIYGQTVQREIIKFINYLRNNGGSTIIGRYVPLNLNCTNSTTCTWKSTNRAAKYLNWDNRMKWSLNNSIYYFRAYTTNETTKWNSIQLSVSLFARLCMKYAPTKANGEVNMKISVAVVAMIIVILIGVLFVLLRKKLRSAFIRNKIAIDIIQQQHSNTSGKPIYAEISQAAEDNSNQNQTSIQYADLNWSTNISEVQQNDSKPVEDQKDNYFGPMGDVYASVQKS